MGGEWTHITTCCSIALELVLILLAKTDFNLEKRFQPVIFILKNCGENSPIWLLKKSPKSNMVKGTFWGKKKIQKNSSHIWREESYEIAKNFGQFGQIFRNFLLLKSPYLANRF